MRKLEVASFIHILPKKKICYSIRDQKNFFGREKNEQKLFSWFWNYINSYVRCLPVPHENNVTISFRVK